MAAARVIRVRRSDHSKESSLLVHLSPCGPSSLDLLLQATDGIHSYSTNIEGSSILELKAKQNNHTSEQWAAALKAILLGQETPMSKTFENLELVAFSHSENELCLLLQQLVSGISQRLGAITLQRRTETAIAVFDWAAIAAVQAKESESKVFELEEKIAELNAALTSLNDQMHEFTTMKEILDRDTFEKFKRLLNNKKLKIRDQQRLLATSNIDSETSNATGQSKSVTTGSKQSIPHKWTGSLLTSCLNPAKREMKMKQRGQVAGATDGDAQSDHSESDKDTTVSTEDESLDSKTPADTSSNELPTASNSISMAVESPPSHAGTFLKPDLEDVQAPAAYSTLEEETDDEL